MSSFKCKCCDSNGDSSSITASVCRYHQQQVCRSHHAVRQTCCCAGALLNSRKRERRPPAGLAGFIVGSGEGREQESSIATAVAPVVLPRQIVDRQPRAAESVPRVISYNKVDATHMNVVVELDGDRFTGTVERRSVPQGSGEIMSVRVHVPHQEQHCTK